MRPRGSSATGRLGRVSDDTTRIVVKGVPPYDGEYELDTDRAFSTREWHWIKKIAGYMPLTVGEGFAGGDPELFVAVAVIAMCRSGKIRREDALQVAEHIAEAPYELTTITLVGGAQEEAEDELPPGLTSGHAGSSGSGSLENESSNSKNQISSGPDSKTDSDRSDVSHQDIGIGGSGMSVPRLVATGLGS